jgi:hypothetical protein
MRQETGNNERIISSEFEGIQSVSFFFSQDRMKLPSIGEEPPLSRRVPAAPRSAEWFRKSPFTFKITKNIIVICNTI